MLIAHGARHQSSIYNNKLVLPRSAGRSRATDAAAAPVSGDISSSRCVAASDRSAARPRVSQLRPRKTRDRQPVRTAAGRRRAAGGDTYPPTPATPGSTRQHRPHRAAPGGPETSARPIRRHTVSVTHRHPPSRHHNCCQPLLSVPLRPPPASVVGSAASHVAGPGRVLLFVFEPISAVWAGPGSRSGPVGAVSEIDSDRHLYQQSEKLRLSDLSSTSSTAPSARIVQALVELTLFSLISQELPEPPKLLRAFLELTLKKQQDQPGLRLAQSLATTVANGHDQRPW